jgi:poly-gamma-glutamate synthesis protein (capsule biosynthesis protein)
VFRLRVRRYRSGVKRSTLAGLFLVSLVAACNPDPTTAPPPRPGSAAPAFAGRIEGVSVADLGASWRPGCPLGPLDLRRIVVSHWGYDGTVHEGQLIVAIPHAESLLGVFRALYDARFPIERMEPVASFGADDNRSMAANNSSAFNCRTVAGRSTWSEHAFGAAIDLNPVQNPYVSGASVAPPAGRAWTDRSSVVPGMIVADGPVVRAFAAIGWPWGGAWRTAKDYQHFSASGR